MFSIKRKATGKVVARVDRERWLEAVLWNMPNGVYAIEDSRGNEIRAAVVRGGRITFAK